MTRVVLRFPPTLELDEIVGFVRSLSSPLNMNILKSSPAVVFELTASSQSTTWSLEVEGAQLERVVGQLRAHLPSVGIGEDAGEPESEGGVRTVVELRLSDLRRPLRTDIAAETAAGLLATFQDLRQGEVVRIQWHLGPVVARALVKASPSRKQPRSLLERLNEGPRIDSEQAQAAKRKQQEPVFAALGRIAVSGASRQRTRAVVQSTLAHLRMTSQPGVHLQVRSIGNGRAARRFDAGSVPRVEWPCHLNAEEFACLLAWPIGAPVAAGVVYSGRRELPFAEGLTFAPSTAEIMSVRGHRPLRIIGRGTYPGREGSVSLAATDALHHLHVIGPTGVGKSTLLANLAVQDIAAGRSVVVIEPKGDLVSDILDRIPEDRIGDVVVLDPSDDDNAVGMNVLTGPVGRAETTVDALVHLLRMNFASSWGPRTQDVLSGALLTLARCPGMTLVELPLLLSDQRFRRSLTISLQGDVALGPFWNWYESLSDGERAQVISPVLNKVRPFVMRSGIRRIVGQATPKFEMLDVLTKRSILLVPLQRGVIGPEMANLLAGLVISQLWQVGQSRAAIEPSKRHPVMVYLDEFQNYMHLPTELDDVLAQARGYGIGLTLAHQHLGQLSSPQMKSAVLLNARSRIVFQSGERDARELATELGGGLDTNDIVNLGAYEAFARLMFKGSSTAPGSLRTMPLAPSLGSARLGRERSREKFGTPTGDIDQEILERNQRPAGARAGQSGGRQRRGEK